MFGPGHGRTKRAAETRKETETAARASKRAGLVEIAEKEGQRWPRTREAAVPAVAAVAA